MNSSPTPFETNGKISLPQAEFSPRPEEFFRHLVSERIGGLDLAIVHGSYVYLGPEGPLNRTYRETRIYHNNVFTNAQFTKVIEPPDVDILAIAPYPTAFKNALLSYVGESGILNGLNHFIEMTVVSEEVLRQEINRPEPGSAMKRVFALKDLRGFGNLTLLNDLIRKAKDVIDPEAVEFQEQYNRMKQLYRTNGVNEVNQFDLTREDFGREFPMLLQFYESENSIAPFPRIREKITFPYPMKLRAWEYYDSNGKLIDPSTYKIND